MGGKIEIKKRKKPGEREERNIKRGQEKAFKVEPTLFKGTEESNYISYKCLCVLQPSYVWGVFPV